MAPKLDYPPHDGYQKEGTWVPIYQKTDQDWWKWSHDYQNYFSPNGFLKSSLYWMLLIIGPYFLNLFMTMVVGFLNRSPPPNRRR
eukprot:Nk52_evm1s863 gene=Nk52_evmTU1s863